MYNDDIHSADIATSVREMLFSLYFPLINSVKIYYFVYLATHVKPPSKVIIFLS